MFRATDQRLTKKQEKTQEQDRSKYMYLHTHEEEQLADLISARSSMCNYSQTASYNDE